MPCSLKRTDCPVSVKAQARRRGHRNPPPKRLARTWDRTPHWLRDPEIEAKAKEYARTTYFCWVCGTGGIIDCALCEGNGQLLTEPGEAGAPFYIGTKRCSNCNGLGKLPCPNCAGMEYELGPPQPFRGGRPFDLD